MEARRETKRRVIAVILVSVITAILYLPIYIYLIKEWLYNPYYGHGFLVVLVSGFIFWLRRHHLEVVKIWSPGILLLASGLALCVFAFLSLMQSLAAFSFVIVLFGLVAAFFERRGLKLFSFPIVFLVFMVPLPFFNNISYWLQRVTTDSSAGIARLVGIQTVITGNQIAIPSATFVVGIPCSGMHSLISLLALSAILAFLINGSTWKRSILFLSAFPIAIITNILRVAAILLIASHWGAATALSFFHTFSSILLFIVAFVFLILIIRLLRCRFRTWRELAYE